MESNVGSDTISISEMLGNESMSKWFYSSWIER